MFYAEIFKTLNKKKIKYLVIGGVAVNLHGYDRMTGDIDLMISLDENNVKKFAAFAEARGYKSRTPVVIQDLADGKKRKEWIEEKNAKVFSIYNPKNLFESIDVMIMEYIDFDVAYKNREYAESSGLRIPLISIDDLIKLKNIAGRERDKTDVKALQVIKELKNEKGRERI
jgi:predicted nucleotidyltransferase